MIQGASESESELGPMQDRDSESRVTSPRHESAGGAADSAWRLASAGPARDRAGTGAPSTAGPGWCLGLRHGAGHNSGSRLGLD